MGIIKINNLTMALFPRGKMTGYYKAGSSECVKDTWRFYRSSDSKVQAVATRRDMDSWLGRFWKDSDTRINFLPIDESEPRLGGRVQATQLEINFQTLTFGSTSYTGVYGEAVDAEVEHAIEETPLSSVQRETWSEALFYGI